MYDILHSSNRSSVFTSLLSSPVLGLSIVALGIKNYPRDVRAHLKSFVGRLDMLGIVDKSDLTCRIIKLNIEFWNQDYDSCFGREWQSASYTDVLADS